MKEGGKTNLHTHNPKTVVRWCVDPDGIGKASVTSASGGKKPSDKFLALLQ